MSAASRRLAVGRGRAAVGGAADRLGHRWGARSRPRQSNLKTVGVCQVPFVSAISALRKLSENTLR